MFAKNVAGNVMPPFSLITSCAVVSDCSMRVSIEISLLEPVKMSSSSDSTILIFVKIGIVVRDEIARATSLSDLIKA